MFVSRSAIAKWENGNGMPSDVNIEAICAFFGITQEELFGEHLVEAYKEETHKKLKYKKLCISSLAILSFLLCLLFICIIRNETNKKEYEDYKNMMRNLAGFNEPVASFGNVTEPFASIINDNVLRRTDHVFLNEDVFYVVREKNNNDFVEITRYDYNFAVIKWFDYFVHNAQASEIKDIMATSDKGFLIVNNHYTYYEDNFQYNGYSQITKYNDEDNIEWEYVFTNGETNINAVYEYNHQIYLFTSYSLFPDDDKAANVSDIKKYIFSLDGRLLNDINITNQEWGTLTFVECKEGHFYLYGMYQKNYKTIFHMWVYNQELHLLESKEIDHSLIIRWTYKTNKGIKRYTYQSLEIAGIPIDKKYGDIRLCMNVRDGYFLVFENAIDYLWNVIEKYPYVSYLPTAFQTVYLYINDKGNILWCKSV